MVDDINVTNNNLYLYVPNLIPSVETQLTFNETIQIIYKISFDEWFTEKRLISDLLVQHDIGSARNVSSPKYIIFTHQTSLRSTIPNRKINIAVFDNMDLHKYYVEIDSVRYPRDGVLV